VTWQPWQFNVVSRTSKRFGNAAHRRRISGEAMDTQRTDTLVTYVTPRFGTCDDGGFVNM
jgi:hypothetical protein